MTPPKRPTSALDVSPPVQRSGPSTPLIIDHVFSNPTEQQYTLKLDPAGIIFDVTRLRRHSQELVGELAVRVNGNFPNALTVIDGSLSVADLNFSSAQARSTRAKLLSSRSAVEGLDWAGFLEEFAIKILAAERKGKPAIVLADEPDTDDTTDHWNLNGLPILQDHPMVLFGSGGSGKSYLAMWVAGKLACENIPVLYADWEFSLKDHRRRLGKMFQPMPKNVYYVRCDRPMRDEVERLAGLIQQHGCRYIVCDSMVFALDGRAEDSEQAGIYFRAVRQLKIGSLHIAHTTKADDDSEKKIYGSVFFSNGARSVWFIQRAEQNPAGELQLGLYHRKSNVGELLKPKGFKLVFRDQRTLVETVKVEDVDELAAKLPLLDRMKRELKRGAMTPKALAEACDSTAAIIRKTYSRHTSVFVRVGDKVGLLNAGESTLEF